MSYYSDDRYDVAYHEAMAAEHEAGLAAQAEAEAEAANEQLDKVVADK
jgi:hypothetical protein